MKQCVSAPSYARRREDGEGGWGTPSTGLAQLDACRAPALLTWGRRTQTWGLSSGAGKQPPLPNAQGFGGDLGAAARLGTAAGPVVPPKRRNQ